MLQFIPLFLWFRKESHAYNKGKTLVVSKIPLPDYRADLDERHGTTQKEARCLLQICIGLLNFASVVVSGYV